MLTPAAPEQVSRSTLEREVRHRGNGARYALAGTPVQMLLMLQRTAGNQAVNQLLRQYRSSRQASLGPFLPAVQRCGGKPCNCSPQEKAAHAAVQPMEEEQDLTASGIIPSSVQRDVDSGEDDEASDGGAATAEQAAGTTDAGGGSSESTADQAASAADDTDDASAAQTGENTDTSASPNNAGGGDQSAAGTDEGGNGQTADAADVEPVAPVSGEGESHEEEVFGGSVNLQGRTRAGYGNSFTTTRIHTTPGDTSSCGCAAADCVHISGTLTSTFTMSTQVSLPTPPDGLTDRQRQVAQYLIDNCISPHEQRHVAAFNAYRGTVQTPFDLSCCRADVNSSLQAIHDGVEQARHDSAQSTSDNLDPFNATFDPDCADGADPASCITCPSTP